MARSAGLGKGLASLIPMEEDNTSIPSPQTVPTASLSPNPFQPRKNVEDSGLESLAQSIRTHGVLQPLIVRKKGDTYEIVAGERRWRAATQVGIRFPKAQSNEPQNIYRF